MPDGSFRLNMMQGGVAFVWVLPDDYSIVQRFVSQPPFDLGEVRVPEGSRLSGRAISAEGKPVAGIAVNAYYSGKRMSRFSLTASCRVSVAGRSPMPTADSSSIHCRLATIASCRKTN